MTQRSFFRTSLLSEEDLTADDVAHGSTNPGFTMRTGLAERHVHTFDDFRFMTMLLSSLGFPAKSGLVLEVLRSQPHPLPGRIS
jgi:hypothetical protein